TVSVNLIIQTMEKNTENAKKLIRLAITRMPEKRDCLCACALKGAIITSPKEIPAGVRKKLDIIIGKYI
ncbi:unnamed protein product, partial [marine sediment metagenome]